MTRQLYFLLNHLSFVCEKQRQTLTWQPMLYINCKYGFVTSMAAASCTDGSSNQPTTWQQFSEFLSLADPQHTLANCTSGIFLLQLAKCLKTDGEGSAEPVERSTSSQEASISYRRRIWRVNHKAPAFVWLEEDRCKVVLFISFESIWGAIMIKTTKSPETQASVTSSLSVVEAPVVPFTGLLTLCDVAPIWLQITTVSPS